MLLTLMGEVMAVVKCDLCVGEAGGSKADAVVLISVCRAEGAAED
jgi:hypothetical protein